MDGVTLVNEWLEDNPNVKIIKWESHNIHTTEISEYRHESSIALIVEYEEKEQHDHDGDDWATASKISGESEAGVGPPDMAG